MSNLWGFVQDNKIINTFVDFGRQFDDWKEGEPLPNNVVEIKRMPHPQAEWNQAVEFDGYGLVDGCWTELWKIVEITDPYVLYRLQVKQNKQETWFSTQEYESNKEQVLAEIQKA